MDVDEAMAAYDGVARRDQLLRSMPRHRIDGALRTGRLVRCLPGVLADPWLIDDPGRRLRAAVLYTGGRGALSHTTALWTRGLHDAPECGGVDHVTVPAGVRLVGGPALRIHESGSLAGEPRNTRGGLPVVGVERAVATSWPLLPADERRAAAILAVRDRCTTADRLRGWVDPRSRLPGRAELLRLCALLGDGAHSEFEIWGLEHFFDADLRRRSTAQLRVEVGGRCYFLDRAFEAELVDVELDGTRWHDRPEQRERDHVRDAALASIGWVTVRLSWRRAHDATEATRAELRAILGTRRRQLAGLG